MLLVEWRVFAALFALLLCASATATAAAAPEQTRDNVDSGVDAISAAAVEDQSEDCDKQRVDSKVDKWRWRLWRCRAIPRRPGQ